MIRNFSRDKIHLFLSFASIAVECQGNDDNNEEKKGKADGKDND